MCLGDLVAELLQNNKVNTEEIQMAKMVVIGAGMMGTACASHLARRGHEVNLWGTELDKEIIDILKQRGNHKTLYAPVPQNIKFFQVDQLEEAMDKREIVIIAIISHAIEKIAKRVAPLLREGMTIINVAKGIPKAPYLTLCDLIEDLIPPLLDKKISVVGMGGPARANELVRGIYTEVIFGAKEKRYAEYCSEITRNLQLKANTTYDITGVELCAAMKNSYAIAVGMCQGLSERLKISMDNTKSAFIAQAIMEMSRLIIPYGGKLKTIMGLAGVGDLYLTVQRGRNGAFGKLLGRGKMVEEAMEEKKDQTIEGYTATKGIYRLAKELEEKSKLNIDKNLPLFRQLYAVLYEGKSVQEGINDYQISGVRSSFFTQ